MSEASLRAAWREVFAGRFWNGAGSAGKAAPPSHPSPENRDDLDPLLPARVNRSPADFGVLYLPTGLLPPDPAAARRFLSDLRASFRVELVRPPRLRRLRSGTLALVRLRPRSRSRSSR